MRTACRRSARDSGRPGWRSPSRATRSRARPRRSRRPRSSGGREDGAMKTRGWAITDVGRKRDHNEDSFLCNDELRLYAVADGMGGHLGGERASRMAVEIVERELEQ